MNSNEASAGVSLREQLQEQMRLTVQKAFDNGYYPANDECHNTLMDYLNHDLFDFIHHHDQRIIAEAERRARIDELGYLLEEYGADDWFSDFIQSRLAALTAQQDGQGEGKE